MLEAFCAHLVKTLSWRVLLFYQVYETSTIQKVPSKATGMQGFLRTMGLKTFTGKGDSEDEGCWKLDLISLGSWKFINAKIWNVRSTIVFVFVTQ